MRALIFCILVLFCEGCLADEVMQADEKRLIVGADVHADLGLVGLLGSGLTLSYSIKPWFFGLGATFGRAPYDMIKLYQTGITYTNSLPAGSEIANAHNHHQGLLFTTGPEAGLMFNLFNSEHWLEIGKVGVGIVRYTDTTSDVAFHGSNAHFQGALGYKFRSSLLTLGMTYNLAYLRRSHNLSEIGQDNYLPIQWWGVETAFYFWVF